MSMTGAIGEGVGPIRPGNRVTPSVYHLRPRQTIHPSCVITDLLAQEAQTGNSYRRFETAFPPVQSCRGRNRPI